MKTRHVLTVSKVSAALLLQDAYWYADRAAGNKECFDDITRTEALLRSFRKVRATGIKLSTVDFPRVIATAEALRDRIDAIGIDLDIDARTGEVIPAIVVDGRYADELNGKIVDVKCVQGCFVTVKAVGEDAPIQLHIRHLRTFRPDHEWWQRSFIERANLAILKGAK